eukprot:364282-Chlamydomonas_euryale.AAC.10
MPIQVYLLDDGGSDEKKRFITSLRNPCAKYITGRERKPGQINGKAGYAYTGCVCVPARARQIGVVDSNRSSVLSRMRSDHGACTQLRDQQASLRT